MTIKNFWIEYDAINSSNTFTNGDTINGRIILETTQEMKVNALVFKAKGKARVCWTEHYSQYDTRVYYSTEKYYDMEHHILRKTREDGTEIVGRGKNVFPFSFKIPDRCIPSTFKSTTGRIVHKLKAELKQSMKLTKKAKTHFNFVSKADMNIPGLMEPQYGSKDKTVRVFGSGTIAMDVHTNRMGYKQGEAIQVTVDITNHSTQSVKPKFLVYVKQSYFAQGHRKVCTKDLLKDKVDAVVSCGKKTVTKLITIPRDVLPSIVNCSILKLEYRLKVKLDIKMATDPEIKLPIIVLPAKEVPYPIQPPAPAAFEEFGNLNQPTWERTGQQAVPYPINPLPPPPYENHAMYPIFDSDMKKSTR